jgi:hypothetical protein
MSKARASFAVQIPICIQLRSRLLGERGARGRKPWLFSCNIEAIVTGPPEPGATWGRAMVRSPRHRSSASCGSTFLGLVSGALVVRFF